MMRTPKIGISEKLTAFQVGLQEDDMSTQELLTELAAEAQCIAVDSATVIPLPIPRFIYTTINKIQQPGDLNGLIIGHYSMSEDLKTDIAEHREIHPDTRKYQALLKTRMAEQYPWIPLIESEQLTNSALRENFIICVSALNELNQLGKRKLTRHTLIDFHSRYKLVLMAHNQPKYREIGPFVANIHQWKDLDDFFIVYRKKLMAILQQPASCENHVNAMMHIQGYFNRQQTAEQRSELCQVIHDYRQGRLPLSAPLTLLKKYLSEYPNNYLLTQKYFMFYPNNYI
ncbi:DUF1722 domain-containing protein [uncultured Cedecea sp.]|uniref:YbgA family protein n=1 Tax=uncultured Cedecea sp. TaxID=988762 RepID=UPI002639CDFD|nr:DUF1722 domain-containing protein [uncultured Cedecea sp.]